MGSDGSGEHVIDSVNPSTGEVIDSVIVKGSDLKRAERAVSNARDGFTSWSELSVERRIEFLKEIAEELKDRKEDFTKMISEEVGKPEIEAETEVMDSIGTIEYYCEKVRELEGKEVEFDENLFPGTEGEVEYGPCGVIGLITPWNYPLSLPIWTIVPALLTGNVVVFKPAEDSILTDKLLTETLNSILPENVFRTVYGGPDAGKALVNSDLDKLFFTGSAETGRTIRKNLGSTSADLEMGGKDSAIVCEDADLDLAVEGVVWGALNNAGQVCTSTERVYVVKDNYEEFVDGAVEKVRKLEKGTDFGPLISKNQLEKVKEHVDNAVDNGAEVLVGGEVFPGKGFFYKPTVLVDVDEDMKIMEEETFGPIISIKKVGDVEEAVEFTNRSKYGLGATIWTKDLEKGKSLGKKIDTGMVWINDVNLPMPGGDYWGGTKLSGMRNSKSNLMKCLKAKTFISHSDGKARDWWFPYG